MGAKKKKTQTTMYFVHAKEYVIVIVAIYFDLRENERENTKSKRNLLYLNKLIFHSNMNSALLKNLPINEG